METTLKIWLALLLITLATGCEPPTSQSAHPTTQAMLADSAGRHPPVAKLDTSHVVAEKLVAQLFQALAFAKMQPLLSTYNKTVTLDSANQDSAAPDSIITYVAASNSFVYIKSGSTAAPGAVLLHCQLASASARLTKTIYLGMSKTALETLLGQPFSSNVLLVSETEGYQKFYFTFQKGILQAVAFDSDYLD
jgi:hypothetical protein